MEKEKRLYVVYCDDNATKETINWAEDKVRRALEELENKQYVVVALPTACRLESCAVLL